MPDRYSSQKRSEVMSKVRSKETKFELTFRLLLWKKGLRYRKYYGPYKIDIAFPSCKVAVFLDSCFWHFCPIHGEVPKSNSEFWLKKLERNRARDDEVNKALNQQGWLVIRIWEHELKTDSDRLITSIIDAVRKC